MKRVVADKVQTLLFDGTKGVESSLLGDRELQGDDLAKLTFQADIAAIANLAKHNAAVKYLGTAEVNGTSTHKVQIVLPAGVAFTQYYDIESGLRMKEEIPITTPQGAFTQTIEYSNYEEVSGIKFPKLLVQTVGQVKLELTVASIKINTGLKDSIFKLTKGTK
jgi:hypothetical protein